MTSAHKDGSRQLILLVGSNPLPNYLAACALEPSRIVLVYTKETEGAKARLQRELESKLDESVTVEDEFVEDAACATTVRRALDPLMASDGGQNIHLNYTGGTKVMAAHARLAFKQCGGLPAHASYLDEGDACVEARLRFDDQNSTPLSLSERPKAELTLEVVLALHGVTYTPRHPKNPAPTVADAREILCKVLADVPLASILYCERQRLEDIGNPNKVTEPFRADLRGLSLSLQEFPTKEQLDRFGNGGERKSWFEQWCKFIGGEWLEEWLGAQIRVLNLTPKPEITVGVNSRRGEKKVKLEVDIAVIRGHRAYFISCTTDTTKGLCKSKLFEVAVRARQLGGDLARAALVSLADPSTVSALQSEIDDMWESSNKPRVFGLSDVRTWSDCEGKQANLEKLKTWLES